MPGVFTRRQRRGVLTPTSQAATEVRTAQELRAAVSSIAARGSTADLAKGAATVVIAAPITLDAPLVIPLACTGLTIRAAGKVPVIASGVVATLFEIRAASVTIRDVLCQSPSASNMFTTFVTMGTTANAPDTSSPSIIDNTIEADRVYVEPSSVSTSAPQIRGNRQTEVNASHSASVEIHSINGKVSDNVLADGGGDTVTVGSGGGATTVVGNDFGGGDITTTASNGGNTVGINTNAGTVTLHADDAQVGNSGLPPGYMQFVGKATTETVQSNAVPFSDAELRFTMEANTSYKVRLSVWHVGGIGFFNYGLTGPAAPTSVRAAFTVNGTSSVLYTLDSSYSDHDGTAAGTVAHIDIDAIVQNGANAGTFAYRWSQNVSDASDSSVLAGSSLEYSEL